MKKIIIITIMLTAVLAAMAQQGLAVDKVFKGNSNYNSDILMTIRDGKIFRGTSTYNSDIIANVRDGKVFSGTSNYNSDILFSFDGNLTLIEFVAIWHSTMLL